MIIKLLQWNIWHKEKIENIKKELERFRPDIACLQELGGNLYVNEDINTAEYLGKRLNYNFYYKKANKLVNGSVGNGIFTKFFIIKSKYAYIQKITNAPLGDWSKERRVYIESQIRVDDKLLTVGTTHVSYTSRFEMTEPKKLEVDKLVNELKKHKENFIFAGDLNCDSTSYTIKEISKYLKNCGPNFDQKTWTTKPPHLDKWGWQVDGLDWRLDYIFATSDMKVNSSKIINTKYSDHLPILVEFIL